ncbi:hypothetical protein ABEB36_008841 [Hypothenemus hampei]|uniref:Uncharacterized protein n=1 Tax=Hypothenemus hampei TaxID=57062 RepID=A0ABD1EN75_HYPHA
MIKRFISSFLTCFGLLLVVCISYGKLTYAFTALYRLFILFSGETFNFYYITENKRGHSHDFDDNSAHKNIISRPSISLIIVGYYILRHILQMT